MLITGKEVTKIISLNLDANLHSCSTYCYINEEPNIDKIRSEIDLTNFALEVTVSDIYLADATFTWQVTCDALDSRTSITDAFDITFIREYIDEYYAL